MERENVFHIKNMVCNRCILVVTRLLEKAGFTPLDVGLGTAVVQEKPGREQREAFRKLLEAPVVVRYATGADECYLHKGIDYFLLIFSLRKRP